MTNHQYLDYAVTSLKQKKTDVQQLHVRAVAAAASSNMTDILPDRVLCPNAAAAAAAVTLLEGKTGSECVQLDPQVWLKPP